MKRRVIIDRCFVPSPLLTEMPRRYTGVSRNLDISRQFNDLSKIGRAEFRSTRGASVEDGEHRKSRQERRE